MSETLVVTLTLMTVMSALALLVGGMIGWMARQHSYETTPQVVVDATNIGGCSETVRYLKENQLV